jgi:hypothetical protein
MNQKAEIKNQQLLIWLQKVGTLPWLFLGICFLAQFCLFYQYVHREILWAYPAMWDQTRFLQESHDVLRAILAEGFPRGFIHAFGPTTPTGNLLPMEAGVLYLFFGDSRLTALLVLFLHWIVLQAVVVATIRWLSGRWSVVAIALALLLLAASPFRETGGLTDFRIDFAAFCAFGVFICLAIRSNLFVDRRPSMLAGLVASYLILLRFITLVYLGVIGVMFFVMVVTLRLFRRQPADGDRDRMRLMNLLLVGGLVLAICLPFFWHNRNAIQRYYVVGHATGGEKYIRARESGINSQRDSFLYYPRSVWEEHAGPLFCGTAAMLVLASLVLAGLRRKYPTLESSTAMSERLDATAAYAFLVCCLLGLYLVLTIDTSKSPVVGDIFIPPLWAMISLGLVYATGATGSAVRWLDTALRGLALLLLAIAVCYQISSYGCQGQFTRQRTEVERVLELHDLVGKKCEEFGLSTPAIGTDRIRDVFYPGVLAITQWERHHIALAPRDAYPQGIFAVSENVVMDGLRTADFVLLTLSPDVENSAYPFDNSMQAMHSKLAEFCDREMVPLKDTSFFGQHVRLYMRPSVRVETTYPDWAGEEGTTLYGEAPALRRFPSITLRGAIFGNLHFPNDDRTVTATLEMEDHPPQFVPSTYVDTNGQYTIHLSVPSLDATNEGMVEIRLHFHRFFVPRELGVNEDPRHLVVRPPTSVHLDQPTTSSTPSTNFP